MEQSGSIFGWKAVAILVVLHMLGWIYNWFVYKYLPAKKIHNRTAELVVGGTLGTVSGYGVWIGWNTLVQGYEAILGLMCCFVATGLPMIIGYWMKDAKDDADDEERARRRIEEFSSGARKVVRKDAKHE